MELLQSLEQKQSKIKVSSAVLLSNMVDNNEGSIKLWAIPTIIEKVIIWNLHAYHRYRFSPEPFRSTSLVITDRNLQTIIEKFSKITFPEWEKRLKQADSLVLQCEEFKDKEPESVG
jgi:hypothetical protein